jgi:hypothetical protein
VLYVAEAEDVDAAREEVNAIILGLLSGMRTPGGGASDAD